VRAKETLTLNATLIAIADAKYHYNFWRPIAAIRNGDLDGNDHRAGCLLGAFIRYADAPRVPVCPLHHLGLEAFMQEVAQARIYDGVHYRTSTEVGTAMGQKIGELAATKSLQPLK
jgi:hypothetical protein